MSRIALQALFGPLGLLCVTATFADEPGAAAKTENPFLPTDVIDVGWPGVRGPSLDGRSPERRIADTWPESGPPVLWTREIGQGYSALVAQGGRVYTQSQNLGGQYVHCLDADSGETIWRYRYGWPYEGMGIYPGPRATPTLAGDRLYFAAPDGLIGCLTMDTGRLIWSRNVIEAYEGDGGTGFGYACSPTVIDGLVILPVGGKSASVVALDAEDGSEVWSAGNDPASYCPALPITFGERELVVGYLENSLVIHDLRDGEVLARIELSQGYDEHSAWPVYHEPHLWIAAPFQTGSQLFELRDGDDGGIDLQHVWTDDIMSNDVVSSVLVDGALYGFDIRDVQAKTQRPSRGQFRCIDFLTGKELWSQGTGRTRRGSHNDDPHEIGQAGIIAVDGKLILLNERGELILLRTTPEKCDLLARTSVLGGELTWTPPTLHRGRVYVRNHSRAACIYIGEPELLDASGPVLSVADIPQSEYVDLAGVVLAIEPEYALDVPSIRWLRNWYFAGVIILACSGGLALCVSRCVPSGRRERVSRLVYGVAAFIAGAMGTTVLSRVTGDFVFTWPVCLFVAFEPVAASVRRRTLTREQVRRWCERISFVVFLAVCAAYFLLCRRLSLVFEWSFLIGFAGALPLCRLKDSTVIAAWKGMVGPLVTGMAFTAFYVCGVLPLLFKY